MSRAVALDETPSDSDRIDSAPATPVAVVGAPIPSQVVFIAPLAPAAPPAPAAPALIFRVAHVTTRGGASPLVRLSGELVEGGDGALGREAEAEAPAKGPAGATPTRRAPPPRSDDGPQAPIPGEGPLAVPSSLAGAPLRAGSSPRRSPAGSPLAASLFDRDGTIRRGKGERETEFAAPGGAVGKPAPAARAALTPGSSSSPATMPGKPVPHLRLPGARVPSPGTGPSSALELELAYEEPSPRPKRRRPEPAPYRASLLRTSLAPAPPPPESPHGSESRDGGDRASRTHAPAPCRRQLLCTFGGLPEEIYVDEATRTLRWGPEILALFPTTASLLAVVPLLRRVTVARRPLDDPPALRALLADALRRGDRETVLAAFHAACTGGASPADPAAPAPRTPAPLRARLLKAVADAGADGMDAVPADPAAEPVLEGRVCSSAWGSHTPALAPVAPTPAAAPAPAPGATTPTAATAAAASTAQAPPVDLPSRLDLLLGTMSREGGLPRSDEATVWRELVGREGAADDAGATRPPPLRPLATLRPSGQARLVSLSAATPSFLPDFSATASPPSLIPLGVPAPAPPAPLPGRLVHTRSEAGEPLGSPPRLSGLPIGQPVSRPLSPEYTRE